MNYTQFYKEVRKYASNYASRLFRDEGARIEAVDKAMDLVVDRLLREEITISLAKRMAHDSLFNIFRDTPTNKNKNLKVKLSQIPGAVERSVMTLYSQGHRPAAIARELGKDSSNTRTIIRKWTV